MSTLKDGSMCMECRQVGACQSDCYTQGGGAFTANGFNPDDPRTIITACIMPDGTRGVALTACAPGGAKVRLQYNEGASRFLAAQILEKLQP